MYATARFRGVEIAPGILKDLGLPSLQIMNGDTESNPQTARSQAEKLINRYRGQWAQKRKSALNTVREEAGGQATHIDLHADSQTHDAVAALAEATSGAVRYGYYSSAVLLAHEDAGLLDDVAREVQTVVQNHGFGCRIDEVNARTGVLEAL